MRVQVVLWPYKTTCKKLTRQVPSKLAYGVNTAISMEHIMPSPRIEVPMDMTDRGALEEGIT